MVVQDLRLSGQVCFVGSSSMEVFVKMEGLKEDGSGVRETLLLGQSVWWTSASSGEDVRG